MEVRTNTYLGMDLAVYETVKFAHPNFIKYDGDGEPLGGFNEDGTPFGEFMSWQEKFPDMPKYPTIGKVLIGFEASGQDMLSFGMLASAYGLTISGYPTDSNIVMAGIGEAKQYKSELAARETEAIAALPKEVL